MSANGVERRFTPRMQLRLPIDLSLATAIAPPEHVESLNISRRGVYLSTALPITAGAPVELRFTMPEEIIGKPERAWRCVGRVVRVDRPRRFWGRRGVGIQFDYYELVPAPDEIRLIKAKPRGVNARSKFLERAKNASSLN